MSDVLIWFDLGVRWLSPEASCCFGFQEEHDYDYADGLQQVHALLRPLNERASPLHGTVYNRCVCARLHASCVYAPCVRAIAGESLLCVYAPGRLSAPTLHPARVAPT